MWYFKVCSGITGICIYFPGYFEKELERDKISVVDDGCNPEAPPPRAMIDLEVSRIPSHPLALPFDLFTPVLPLLIGIFQSRTLRTLHT